MNLIANAIDAIEDSYEKQHSQAIKILPGQIKIRTSIEGESVALHFQDNGIGMAEAVKTKIFEPLFTTKGVGKGTGLGLSITQEIVVNKHNGSLKVNSIPEQGVEFTVCIPVMQT